MTQGQRGGAGLSHRDLVLLRRAAEDAIEAGNPRYAPFVDAVANPLKMLALVELATRGLQAQLAQDAGAADKDVSPRLSQ